MQVLVKALSGEGSFVMQVLVKMGQTVTPGTLVATVTAGQAQPSALASVPAMTDSSAAQTAPPTDGAGCEFLAATFRCSM